MDYLTEHKVERARLLGALRETIDRAEAEGRDMSRREAARFTELEGELAKLDGVARVAARHADDGQTWRSLPPVSGTPAARQAAREAAHAATESTGFDPRLAQGTGSPWLAEPAEPRPLTAGESVAGWARGRAGGNPEQWQAADSGELRLSSLIAALVTGGQPDFLSGPEIVALTGGSGPGGGYLVPEPLAVGMIDRVRAAARVFQAGARVVPMDVDTLSIARLTAGETPEWKTEGEAIAEKSMTFDRVTFTARTLPVLVKLSKELFEDLSSEGRRLIEGEISEQLAIELDRAVLRGSGTPPEPRGIRNQTNVQIHELGSGNGAPVTAYDDLLDALGLIREQNGEATGILMSSREATTFDKMKVATGAPLDAPAAIGRIPRYVTNQIPTTLSVGGSDDCSEIYVCDWSSVLVGMRTSLDLRVRVLSERYADYGQIGLFGVPPLWWTSAD